MEDTFGSVDNLSNILPSDVVNPSSRSNKDKKKNGFSDALKEKMKEKQEKKKHDQDELIIDEEHKEHIQPLENKSRIPEAAPSLSVSGSRSERFSISSFTHA